MTLMKLSFFSGPVEMTTPFGKIQDLEFKILQALMHKLQLLGLEQKNRQWCFQSLGRHICTQNTYKLISILGVLV